MWNKKFYFVFIALLIGLCVGKAYAQNIVFSTETVEKSGLEDRFELSFVLQNGNKPSNFTPPSFAGFKVLQGPVQSSQSNLSIINGKTKRSTTLRLTYVLEPTKKGSFTINGAKISIDGETYTSNPVRIQVVDGSLARQRQQQADPFWDDDPFEALRQQQQRMQQMMQQMAPGNRPSQPNAHAASDMDEKHLHDNIFIKVEVDNTRPYEGQQITASYKLYTRLPMNMNLAQLPSLNGFWSEDYKIPNPPKPTVEVINGKEYQVFLLKKSALFPQHSGKLVLDPTVAEGVVRVAESTNRQNPFANDPFSSLFMDDPFFNNHFFSGVQYRDVETKISSKPIAINVQPLPKGGQPENFGGAVGSFKIETDIDSLTLHTGSSANFYFTIKGSGNFQLIGEPKIDFPPSLNALDPLVRDSVISRSPNIAGKKTFTYSLSPDQPGKFIIPPTTFTYFDPKDKSYKTLKTQEIEIDVKKGKEMPTSNLALSLSDINQHASGKQTWKSGSFLFVGSTAYWLLYLLALVGFIVMVFLNRRKKDMAENEVFWKKKKANKVAWKRLGQARKLLAGNQNHIAFYEEVSKAVWLYLSDKLNIPLSELSKENIAENLRQHEIEEERISKLNHLISECEMALYSPSGGQHQKAHTLDAASELIGDFEDKLRKTNKVAFNVS